MNEVKHTIGLMHFDDPNDPFKDDLNNMTWTLRSGSYEITQDHAKFDKCINLKGVNLSTNIFEIQDDITVDFWTYIYTNTDYEILFSINEVNTGYAYSFIRLMAYNFFYISRYHGDGVTPIYALANGNLIHVAMVSDSNNKQMRIYINGKLSNTLDYYIFTKKVSISFGYSNTDNIPTYNYLSELRISNCARYDSDFDPPTKKYNVFINKLYECNKNTYGIVENES